MYQQFPLKKRRALGSFFSSSRPAVNVANETISGSSAWTAGIILRVNHAWPILLGNYLWHSMAPKQSMIIIFVICFPIVSSKTRTSSTCPTDWEVLRDQAEMADSRSSMMRRTSQIFTPQIPAVPSNKLMASQPACSPHPQWQYKDLAKPGHQSHESNHSHTGIYHLGTHTCLAPNELVAQEAWYW